MSLSLCEWFGPGICETMQLTVNTTLCAQSFLMQVREKGNILGTMMPLKNILEGSQTRTDFLYHTIASKTEISPTKLLGLVHSKPLALFSLVYGYTELLREGDGNGFPGVM